MRLFLDKINNWQTWLIFLIITLLLFGSSLWVGFLSDDWHWLWLSKNIPWSPTIFITNYEGTNLGGSYNPITFILFKIGYSLFGLQAWTYHLVSLLVHATNVFLVYLLAKKIFIIAKFNYSRFFALAAAILFLLWPTQSEAVNWLAAWPHLWGMSGYLLTFLFYFKWRREKTSKFFWWSLLSFILALGIKELAMSLPVMVLLWEIFFYSLDKKNKINWRLLFYFVILFAFGWFRYSATKAIFGYYGRQQLGWPLLEWVGNLGAFLNDLFTFSFLREIYYKIWYHGLESLAIVILAGLAGYFWFTFWQKKWLQFVLSASVLLCLLPMAPLGLQRLSLADERYLYLASGFFVIWLVLAISELVKKYKINLIIFICLLVICLPVIFYKNYIWLQAGSVSRKIVASLPELKIDPSRPLVSVGLPDNLSGAQVFRNNLQQALELTYPEYQNKIIPLPIYSLINPKNYFKQLLKWRPDQLGWFAESIDGSFVITGQTSIVIDNIYWELWHYNYQNYTANIIRLMHRGNENPQWLTFYQGKLIIQ